MVLEHEFNRIVNRKCIQKIMRKYNIICPIRKANPYRRMLKATREHKVVPNLLNREFKQGLVGKRIIFGHMKDEVDFKNCMTFKELKLAIDDYMDYYNNYRYQYGLKKLAPVQYRNQLLAA